MQLPLYFYSYNMYISKMFKKIFLFFLLFCIFILFYASDSMYAQGKLKRAALNPHWSSQLQLAGYLTTFFFYEHELNFPEDGIIVEIEHNAQDAPQSDDITTMMVIQYRGNIHCKQEDMNYG